MNGDQYGRKHGDLLKLNDSCRWEMRKLRISKKTYAKEKEYSRLQEEER